MYSCIITGSGRSGTSLLAGTLAGSGYFMGKSLIPPRPANPKGFFESPNINKDINECILLKYLPNFELGQRWLGALPLNIKVLCNDKEIKNRIKTATKRIPFCYKDPRFCYTLPVWYPHITNSKILCIFRHPSKTANSMIKEINTAKYLKNLRNKLSFFDCIKVWGSSYSHLLKSYDRDNKARWMFIQYDQMFDAGKLNDISVFLDTKVNFEFPEIRFSRSTISKIALPKRIEGLYTLLCRLAGVL